MTTELSPDEAELLKLLLVMTGREERLASESLVEKSQITGIRAIWPVLRTATEKGMDYEARCDLLNRLLLSLGIKPVSTTFFKVVFEDVDFSDLSQVRDRISGFRILCMLEFGSFRYGYKQFRNGPLIQQKWRGHFPTESEAAERARRLRARPEPVGLVPISASQLFALGYLASEHAARINEARKKLLAILQDGLRGAVATFTDLQALARKAGEERLTALIARAGIPGAEALVAPDLPLFSGGKTFSESVGILIESCVTVDDEAIRHAQEEGLQNARTYLALHDLDIYVATSMRDPLHFTTNWAFIDRLFHKGDLADWHLRYFDPTQAFLPDRIQKGLMECLMIKRSALTVYNAQESDTFGKDSEAGVTLAQGKPVVVFVARLFEYLAPVKNMYEAVDEAARVDRDFLIDRLKERGLLDGTEADALRGPEKSKADVVAALIGKHVSGTINALGRDRLEMELLRHGYDPELSGGDLTKFVIHRIQMLERRALTFRDVHPLALQTSPIDGVARGVMVTRTVEDTARIVSGLLRGTLAYDIVEDEANWLLVERLSRSPVRVVTKDPVLTCAFWSEEWGAGTIEPD